jgi:hypothetical protein
MGQVLTVSLIPPNALHLPQFALKRLQDFLLQGAMAKRGKYGQGRVYRPKYKTPDGKEKTVNKWYVQYYDRDGKQVSRKHRFEDREGSTRHSSCKTWASSARNRTMRRRKGAPLW